ncbi:MAG: glycosyl hydrolase family 28-related protein, partial [candidate division KSB1 bacterium]|nr:glycosyl hydrolase family 28-related protein [candidate division KSB1 bacterium]
MNRHLLVFLLLPSIIPAAEYNILDFGAVGDGTTVNTAAVQRAIDAASLAGGRVVIPPGVFVSGSLQLKSNVELYLEAGAVLKGSNRVEDYQLEGRKRGLIFAYEALNITLSGQGIIDGNGTCFFDPNRPHWGPDFDRRFTRQGEKYMD